MKLFTHVLTPHWDLPSVLRWLSGDPFERLSQAPVDALSFTYCPWFQPNAAAGVGSTTGVRAHTTQSVAVSMVVRLSGIHLCGDVMVYSKPLSLFTGWT